LTVPQDRASDSDATVRLLVVRIDPPSVAVAPDPMLVAGADIGDEPLIGTFAPLATRVERTVYVLEPRGVGHSEPLLTCPEVDGLAVDVAEAPSGDQAVRDDFLDAVAACRARLMADGVDIASFGVSEAAADIEDLRRVLQIPQWNLVSYGSNSRFVLESVRRFPDGVRAIALDSPEFPQSALQIGPEDFRHAVSELSVACGLQADCAAAVPDLEAILPATVAQLDASPLEIDLGPPDETDRAGQAARVLLDGGALLRAVRFALGGDGPANATRLPGALALVAAGEPAALFGEILANDPTFCAGYRPLCPRETADFSLGVYLTVLCRDLVPFSNDGEVGEQLGESPYRRMFDDNPYIDACEEWDVPTGDPGVHQPFSTDLPVLLLTGRLDSFSSAAAAEEVAASLPRARALDVPAQTHNVLGFTECTLAIRNQWINDPNGAPDTACLDDLSIAFDMSGR
jgi:pimeloyl-ACP methyl ester carboxylesterase